VTQVIAFEGNGKLTEFGGGYDDWQRYTQKRIEDEKATINAQQAKAKQSAASATSQPASKPAASKLSFKEQKELEELPLAIDKLEAEQASINAELVKPENYSDAALIKTLQARLDEITAEIENKITRWDALEKKI
jgi:ATP-binding cassette subfamily F protein uup